MRTAFRILVFSGSFAVIVPQAAAVATAGPAISPAEKAQSADYFRAPLDSELDTRIALAAPSAEELDLADKRAAAQRSGTVIGLTRSKALAGNPVSTVHWRAHGQGAIAVIRVRSEGARALRVGIRLAAGVRDADLRVAGVDPFGNATAVTRIGWEILELQPRVEGRIEYWTPTTVGDTQRIEIWLLGLPDPAATALEVFDVSHLFAHPAEQQAPVDKLLGCHVELACISEASYRTQGRAVARMNFIKNGLSVVCTGSLLNDRVSSFTPLFATANHCISTAAVAATLETWWFHEPSTCGGFVPAATRRSGGARLLVTDFDSDFTFLRLNENAPGGSFFLGWSASPFNVNEVAWGIHHPSGTPKKFSYGSFTRHLRVTSNNTGVTFGKLFNEITFVQGTVERGSSGSPIITGDGRFRGTLFGSQDSCSDRRAFYSDFAQTYPLIAAYLDGTTSSDDYGNTPASAAAINANTQFLARLNSATDQDWFRIVLDGSGTWTVRSYTTSSTPTDTVGRIYSSDGTTVLAENDDGTDVNFVLSGRAGPGTYYVRVIGYNGATGDYGFQSTFALDVDDHANSASSATVLAPVTTSGGNLESAADQDWFRVTFNSAGTWTVASSGNTDAIGRIYNASLALVAENDDANPPDRNFLVSTTVAAGSTYYLQVTGFEGATGAYGISSAFSGGATGGANYTDLWWNAAESGWGLNLNHQGDIMFAALFTYDSSGRDYWLVASNLARQGDGSFTGILYDTEGPAFAAVPWSSISATARGTMSISFNASGTAATLVYNIGSVTVSKSIVRQRFGTGPTCTFSAGSRADATNYQDLWWNPAEPGWGINLTHQGTTIFATLFTYDTDRLNMWLVASDLRRQFDGSYTGILYRTRGPAYNAQPWTAITASAVGNMTLRFANGVSGTLTYSVNGITVTKSFERQVFSSPRTQCQ